MKRQAVYNFRLVPVGVVVTLGLPFILVFLTGCAGKESEKPATGYPGGQKPGAVMNMTNEPGYNTKGGATGAAGGKGYPTSHGAPTSGGH